MNRFIFDFVPSFFKQKILSYVKQGHCQLYCITYLRGKSSVLRDFDRIEIEQKLIKKVDISVILDMKKHNTFRKSFTTP